MRDKKQYTNCRIVVLHCAKVVSLKILSIILLQVLPTALLNCYLFPYKKSHDCFLQRKSSIVSSDDTTTFSFLEVFILLV